MHWNVSGGSEPLKKQQWGGGGGIWHFEHQKFANLSACKAQEHQHKIMIAFLECNKSARRVHVYVRPSDRVQ